MMTACARHISANPQWYHGGMTADAFFHDGSRLELYANDSFSLLLPTDGDWRSAHKRRTYSARNIVRSRDHTTLSVVLYPREKIGGMYKDGETFLAQTQRLPTDIQVDTRTGASPVWITQYTNGEVDRYFALIEGAEALLEIDCTCDPHAPGPPLEEIAASAQMTTPSTMNEPRWCTLHLPDVTIEVPDDWQQRDEYNRPFDTPYITDARGVAIVRVDSAYTLRQLSPPQYRVQPLEPGKNLRTYLIGLKGERRRSSMDGATYQLQGEDRVRTKGVRGTRLRYQGYSPSGVRGSMEWYHELLLLEVGAATLLVTVYCDWIERHRYRRIFARITESLRPA